MFRRREAVPLFDFVAERNQFRSNVTPPPRQRPSVSQLTGRTLTGLTIVAGLVGSLLLGHAVAGVRAPHRPTASSPKRPSVADPYGPPGVVGRRGTSVASPVTAPSRCAW